jgi:phage shock protein C
MSNEYKRLYRSRNNRMIAGVCGGLGEYSNMDPTIVRLLFVVGTIVTAGTLILLYLAMMLFVPEAPMA